MQESDPYGARLITLQSHVGSLYDMDRDRSVEIALLESEIKGLREDLMQTLAVVLTLQARLEQR